MLFNCLQKVSSMKILQVISSFPPAYSYGGALKVANDYSQALSQLGHDVTVYTTDVKDLNSRFEIKDNPQWVENVEVHRFRNLSNRMATHNYPIAPALALALRKNVHNFDIVHLHEYRSFQAFSASYYSKKNSVPYVLQPHGSSTIILEKQSLKRLFDKICGEKIIRNACKLIAVSNVELHQFNQLKLDNNRVVIPNAINTVDCGNLPMKGNFKDKYGLLPNEKIILYLGRIHKIKGLKNLLLAFERYSWQYNNSKLVIVGSDDGYLSYIKKMIQKLGIGNKVLFTGPLYGNNKLEAYVDADVLVYPAIYEIFGLVPFEAIICGTPVIVTNDCGCGEIIKSLDCGYVVKYGDLEDMENKIHLALYDDVSNKKMLNIGKKYINTELNLKKIAIDLEKVYEDCVCNF